MRDFGGGCEAEGLLVELDAGRDRDVGIDDAGAGADAGAPDPDAYLLRMEENVN
jgi:hypothetical protein